MRNSSLLVAILALVQYQQLLFGPIVVFGFSTSSRNVASLSPYAGCGIQHPHNFPSFSFRKRYTWVGVSMAEQEEGSVATEGAGSKEEEELSKVVFSEKAEELSAVQRLRRKLFRPKQNDEAQLTFKQRLAKSGLPVLLSYSWLSTSSAAVAWSLAWYVHCKRSLITPLAAGQWKPFLAVYAGFWVFNGILRPLRLAGAISLSPFFDKVIKSISNRFRVTKNVAFGAALVAFNVLGSSLLFALGISLASVVTGVPLMPPRP